jgi:hypothetical protein
MGFLHGATELFLSQFLFLRVSYTVFIFLLLYFLDALFWLAHNIPNPGQGFSRFSSVSSNLPVNSSEVDLAALFIHDFQNIKK